MKTLLAIALATFAQAALASDIQTHEMTLKDEVVQLNLALNAETVRCLVGDYGASSLKISVPSLKYYTVFSHTTEGETLPCINAGFCGDTPLGRGNPERVPETIIDVKNPFQLTDLRIVLTETLTLDHAGKTCTRTLNEHVSATVRGMDFQHHAGAGIGTMKYETCLNIISGS